MSIYLSYFLFAFIGIFAGLMGGLLGVGGGIIVVPALLLVFNLLNFPDESGMHMAVGTSLAAMVSTAASSAWGHYKMKGVYWHIFKEMSIGVIIGAILGSLIAAHLPDNALTLIFGVFLLLLGVYFLLKKDSENISAGHTQPFPAAFTLIGALTGIISSILGIGGGIITVPVLTAFRVPLKNAISTSAAIGFLIAVFGALSFLYFGLGKSEVSGSIGYIYIPAFIFISLTSAISAQYGAKLAYYLQTHILKSIFGIFLIIVGILMIFKG